MNKRRLAAIARWLEAGAPHKQGVTGFGMSYGVRHDGCNTTCCIAGAADSFFGERIGIATVKADHACTGLPEEMYGILHAHARDLLDLTEEQAECLFTPCNSYAYHDASAGTTLYIGPARAARIIRHLIKTGDVRWDLFGN